ncbi:hypothetical protein E2C01_059883 [Portunus trituberculatus]|uniref:Uncharacterized protein n=1 Tax=Portunus trituberculatus TaxID=210409 RepID=A0A5B7H902_PORTR|nr:hypothetical protein [Portunus trituberculatus]
MAADSKVRETPGVGQHLTLPPCAAAATTATTPCIAECLVMNAVPDSPWHPCDGHPACSAPRQAATPLNATSLLSRHVLIK